MFLKKVIIIMLLIIVLFIMFGMYYKVFNKSTYNSDSKWIIKVIDNESKKELDNSIIIITDLDKKYEIDNDNNIISLPQKPSYPEKGNYPYGYTIITYSEGYLPRIDHNMIMGKDGITTIEIELSKPLAFENRSYIEVFHSLGEVMLVDFLSYYLDNTNN